ncbi:MAG TPA: hypothetical protein PKY78_06465 [Candidatus Omnitrophota bacterium]|nr:hypothetical protein [Candidatus Omnitrophota bacterium]HPS20611.1 hypothetical protein [Candidatus Omnitrophota bacterium]
MNRTAFLLMMLIFAIFFVKDVFSEDGKYVVKDILDNNGVLDVRRISDKEGTIRGEEDFRDNGTVERRVWYDEKGHKIGECLYNGDGTLREGPDGWAAMRFYYQDGKLADERYYDDDGKIKMRKSYDDEGELVEKDYVDDGRVDPYEEYEPIPPLLGSEEVKTYDKNGMPESDMTVERW